MKDEFNYFKKGKVLIWLCLVPVKSGKKSKQWDKNKYKWKKTFNFVGDKVGEKINIYIFEVGSTNSFHPN